jgi:hypothetical protein
MALEGRYEMNSMQKIDNNVNQAGVHLISILTNLGHRYRQYGMLSISTLGLTKCVGILRLNMTNLDKDFVRDYY